MGSSDFSSVVRYLTLSFDSFAASVTFMSIAFHSLCACDRAAMDTPRTSRHSLDLSCSVMELNFAMRLRQYSSSVSGPASSDSFRPSSTPLSSSSVRSHQSCNTICMSAAVFGSSAAAAKAAGLSSMDSTYFRGGFISSTPPCRELDASVSVAPNLATLCTNSCVFSSCALPHCVWFLSTGTKRFATRARKESNAEPRISPAIMSCSKPFSCTPLGFVRMKYMAWESDWRDSTSPVVTKSRFGALSFTTKPPASVEDRSSAWR